jgi:hypothetical protein
MQSNQGLSFRVVVSVGLLLALPVVAMAQTQSAASSAEFLPNRSIKQRLQQLRQAAAQTTAVATETPSSPSTSAPRSRDSAHQIFPPQSARLPGAPVAAERYVFGRMDLATSDYPN